MEIRPMRAELFLADRDRQTDRHDEASSRFCYFANETNKGMSHE